MMPDPQTGDILAFYYTTDINSQKIERLIDARILRDDYEFVGVVETAKRQLHVLASNRTSTSHPAGAVMDHDGEFVDSFLKGTDERDKDSVRRASLFDHVLEMLKEQPEYTHAFVATVYGKRRRKQLRYGYLTTRKNTCSSPVPTSPNPRALKWNSTTSCRQHCRQRKPPTGRSRIFSHA